VAVSSIQAMMNQHTVAAYAASKAALNGLIRAIAIDEAANGIRANSVFPASVYTPMLRAAARDFSDGTDEQIEDLVRRWGRAHPIGRVADTTEVADVVAFLCSPRSGFITGVSLPVDGGLLIGAPVQLP